MIFTRHAIERYRQFHMLDQPTATDEDARQLLERFGPASVLVKARTHRGDPIWLCEALGVELVAKHESGVVTIVTVLPPPQFRGLTPLQAEQAEANARAAIERAAVAEREFAEAKTALAEKVAAAKESNRRASAARQAADHAAAVQRKAELRAAQAELSRVRDTATEACAERDVLCAVLKSMRTQLSIESNVEQLKQALRVAVRRMIEVGDEDGIAAVAAVEPALTSEAFVTADQRVKREQRRLRAAGGDA